MDVLGQEPGAGARSVGMQAEPAASEPAARACRAPLACRCSWLASQEASTSYFTIFHFYFDLENHGEAFAQGLALAELGLETPKKLLEALRQFAAAPYGLLRVRDFEDLSYGGTKFYFGPDWVLHTAGLDKMHGAKDDWLGTPPSWYTPPSARNYWSPSKGFPGVVGQTSAFRSTFARHSQRKAARRGIIARAQRKAALP